MEKFAASLDDSVKKDTKKIEDEFRLFCKTAKNKEQRFVSTKSKMRDGMRSVTFGKIPFHFEGPLNSLELSDYKIPELCVSQVPVTH